MSWKHDVRKGMGRGLAGLGAIAGLGAVSPWLMLILVVAVAVIGLIFWVTICIYGLATAFFLFVGGCLFLFILSKMGVDIGKHSWFLASPILLGILGYVVEKFGIWKIGLTVTFNTAQLQFLGLSAETTVGIQIILLIVVLVVCVADFTYAVKNKR